MKYGLGENQLSEIVDIFRKYPEVEEAILFGSRAIGTYKEASDIDIAIKGKDVSVILATKIQSDLEDTYLPFFFDIISFPSITNQDLIKHINTKGIPIYRAGWKKCKLGDVITLHNGKSPIKQKKKDLKHPIYGGNGICGYSTEFNNSSPTVVIGRVGAYCGCVYYCDKAIWVSDNAISVKPKSLTHLRYIYYLLTFLNLNHYAEGSSHPLLTQNIISSIEINLPPLHKQKEIASILSCLDDKIDLLHRQNKTLESIAQTLFHQWFIKEADENWERKPLSRIAEISIGRTPPRKEVQWFSKNPDDVKWISIKDLAEEKVYVFQTSEYLTKEAIEKFNIPMIQKNSVILSFKMTIGRVAITPENMVSNEAIAHFKLLGNTSITKEFLYFFLKSFNFNTLGSTSTIVNSINSTMIKKITIIIPDNKRVMSFSEVVSTIFSKIYKNRKQIITLTTTREDILPRIFKDRNKRRKIYEQ